MALFANTLGGNEDKDNRQFGFNNPVQHLLIFKARLHIQFNHELSALHSIFLLLILMEPTNIIRRKMQASKLNAL